MLPTDSIEEAIIKTFLCRYESKTHNKISQHNHTRNIATIRDPNQKAEIINTSLSILQ